MNVRYHVKNKVAVGRADLTLALQAFEQNRLALFARHGFEGESRWVTDREGRRTYLIGRGVGSCPIVLVHGGLSHAGEWAPLAGRLHGHVIIPDRPGCGLSYPVDYRGLDFRSEAADWLLALVDEVGAERVDLVANSMGGFFAMAFTIAHPGRVRHLALVGAPAGLDRKVPLFPRLLGNPVTGPFITRHPTTDPELLRRRVFARILVAHPERVPQDLLALGIAASTIPGSDWAAYTMLRTILNTRGFRRQLMLRDEMAMLDVPTLFAWGDSDAFAPPSSGRALAARMPDASIEVLPDAGHLPWLDQPEAVAVSLNSFFGRDPRSPGTTGSEGGAL